jgi:hypothetical protein
MELGESEIDICIYTLRGALGVEGKVFHVHIYILGVLIPTK